MGGAVAEGSHGLSPEAHKAIARGAIAGLLARYAERGTFGNATEIVGGRDPRFTFRDFVLMLKSVPRLRKDMLLGLAYNLSKGRMRRAEGHSLRHVPGGKYTFSHRGFCDLAVWEAILAAAAASGGISAEMRAGALACVDMALENGRAIDFDGAPLTVFSYYPSRDHLVPPEHPAYRHFLSWDAGVPDNDSTCIVLGSLLRILLDLGEPLDRLRRPPPVMSAHLALLREHVFGEGRYGRGYLSYDAGVTPSDRGVLTWIRDEHNELDPTSNINVLNFLFLLTAAYPALEPEIAPLAERILGFLGNHAGAGTLFHARLQQYYPPASALFFWYRCSRGADRAGGALRNRLDPKGIMARIDAAMRDMALALFRKGANPSDAALASPFLARERLSVTDPRAGWRDPESSLLHFRDSHYEIFHLLYPVPVICVTENLPVAAYLLFVTELSR